MQLELMRFIMTVRPQADAFERRSTGGAPFADREAWLKDIFAKEITFAHRGIDFHYVPAPEPVDSAIIADHVGRQGITVENTPPEAGFVETRRERWRAALILIDPRSHADGQKASVEVLAEVGRPLAVVDSLCRSINARITPEQFYIEVNAITDPQTFWDFEKENRGLITDVVFELNVPNMFGIRDQLDNEMRELRDFEKAKRAKFEIQSEDGLNLQTERVENMVAHALEGGGAITARTMTRKRFNSRSKAKRQKVEVDLATDANPPTFRELARRVIAGIFG